MPIEDWPAAPRQWLENGVYRQANVVHETDDKVIATRYLELFDIIWNDPEDVSSTFADPALPSSGLEGWMKEGLRGQRGNLLVHTKVIVANFTTDNPVVISGSHNLSVPASNGNDENYLIMRGDTDLADRYGLEILRFYEHYRFRYYAKKLKLRYLLKCPDIVLPCKNFFFMRVFFNTLFT